jgi:hypothetical protein
VAEHLKPDGSRWDQLSLVREATNAEREAIMRDGVAPAFDALAGWEFAGINTAWIASLGGVKKFIKGFYEGPPRTTEGPSPFIQGYNVPVRQNGVGNPHVAKPSPERPKRFGFYRVHHVVPGARHSRFENALLLDYGLGGNPALAPDRVLRDYLVQVYPDNPELLLGYADVAAFGIRFFMSYFVLQRMGRHDFTG